MVDSKPTRRAKLKVAAKTFKRKFAIWWMKYKRSVVEDDGYRWHW